ncbi:hypothetical protein PPERSA_04658 [Pseudocohnilembus persalinus]|uniref:Acyltransferase n=1 Tax=Pseudocohnilembus persalinus TaxID=266149 RepID=A0A0V0R554_PSEPJ|nr:hypothetical protein PPERSA_04658 [Pseudocohnilembus persalinus]|eukprot:KRX09352.1 hypothetical protein PPERSA_04658 [Pseudocohnilembus persalinus]
MEQKEEENKIVYEKTNQINQRRIAKLLGFSIVNGAAVITVSYVLYLINQIVFKKNYKALIIYGILQMHAGFIARKNEVVYKIFSFFDLQNWCNSTKIICEEKVDKEGVLFCWMPHSFMCFNAWFSRFNENSPFYGSLLLGSRMSIKTPIFGSFLQWLGLTGADPDNTQDLMNQRKNVNLVPGGFEEATASHPKQYRLYINDRKGFIKYALQYGYKIHPVFVFNENKGYKSSDILMNLRLKLNKLKLPGVLMFSRYISFPEKDIDNVIVVGRHIEMPKIDNPTQQEIDKYHSIYLMRVKQIFEKNVDKYDPGAELKFWGESKFVRPKL